MFGPIFIGVSHALEIAIYVLKSANGELLCRPLYHVFDNLIDHLLLTGKLVRILFANPSFGANSVLVHQLLNHPMEVPVVLHLYQSLQEILFQHHRTLMAPHKVLL